MEPFKPLAWSPQYTVHDTELDTQHQKLFSITNEVLALYENGSAELLPSLRDLVEYLCTHIRSENKVMLDCDYPGYAAQNKQHVEFIDKLQNFLKNYREEDENLTYNMLFYLHHWIYSHTINMDLKYGQHLLHTRTVDKK
ncbi:MAG: bacteriohemerythrin [Deltaproteobacteria bacterium]|nr:bacteriohemerythrin [Deltaproteobacteria bacterium]